MASKDEFFALLKQRRFAPIFLCQFFSAFADNVFRCSLLILATFHETIASGYNKSMIAALIGGIVILPFFLFSSLAGQIADRFEKSRLIFVIKSVELVVMCLGVFALFTQSLSFLIFILFLNMTQAAFLGPLKYSLLPFYLKGGEIITGNALIESSTFIAILLGSITGGIAISLPQTSLYVISTILILSSLVAWGSSWYLLKSPSADPSLKINPNLYTTSLEIIRSASQDRTLFLSIIGISWFWVIGSMFLTQIASYGKEVIGGNQSLVNLFLFMFTLGIGLGSYLCKSLSKEKIDPRHITWGAIGMTIFIIDLVIASQDVNFAHPDLIGISQFLFFSTNVAHNWRILMDLTMIAVCGGLFTVPLYTTLQIDSDPKFRSRVIAANNIINAFFMVVSSIISMILIAMHVSILSIFFIMGIVNVYVMYRISRLVPQSLLQLFAHGILRVLFRVEVTGLKHFYASGKRTLIIANHTSFLDAILLFAFIPERLNFAIYSHYIDRWWIRILKSSVNLLPLDPVSPMATKHLIEFLKEDKKCLIFPEGRISVTGSLMKIYDGPGMVADKAEATILPIRIDGAQYSYFSHLRGVVRRQLFPKITITILPSQNVTVDHNIKGKERRKIMSNKVYDIMAGMMFETSSYQKTIFSSLIEAAKIHGMSRPIVEDIHWEPQTYRRLLMRSFILGKFLFDRTVLGERVGILLPTSIAALTSFLGLHSIGRVPAMLNYSLGTQILSDTCQLARIRSVITSRTFIEKAYLVDIIQTLSANVQVIYIEDIRSQISIGEKIYGFWCSLFPETAYRSIRQVTKPEDSAVILFTSGSEGVPKGVGLSHLNLNANRFQVISTVDFNSQDTVLNVLPMFHSFGLTGGTLIPLLQGIRTFYYPSPLHYRTITYVAYDINATIFFATDTFLSRYARLAHPYDFFATRYVFAGAEKLQPETKQLWMERFGIQILEAYGTTETAPALSLSTRMHHKDGYVGRLLPDIQYHLKPVEGISDGGQLLVKGPNVMLGYINSHTGRIVPTSSKFTDFDEESQLGWYDTGDIVRVDEQGFVKILGRLKRFAKIGGEMISLVAIEDRLNVLWPEHKNVMFAVPDARKGEQLILLTTGIITREQISTSLKKQGFTELYFPKTIFHVDQIPLLATGKVDLRGAKSIAESLLAQKNEEKASFDYHAKEVYE
jgi:acyl-[acyl-carrier-protein]-phospholipid O-acyltransferase/long-chain-fatty-acid--[acyl-carrier-protein] ligase